MDIRKQIIFASLPPKIDKGARANYHECVDTN